jgi:hypothetical protein
MLRTLKSLSTLFALMVMVVAATTIAQVGTAKSVSSVSRGDTGKVAAGAYDYNLNVIVPTANPTFDATGRWISNAGDEMQIFQEKDEVNATFVNAGWAHRLAGRYVNPTTIRMVLIRRTRSGGCEVTMDLDLNVTSVNTLSGAAVASENGCGLSKGQSYPGTWKRVL